MAEAKSEVCSLSMLQANPFILHHVPAVRRLRSVLTHSVSPEADPIN